MNTNESTISQAQNDDIIVLGVASIETKGPPGAGEPIGLAVGLGISEE